MNFRLKYFKITELRTLRKKVTPELLQCDSKFTPTLFQKRI